MPEEAGACNDGPVSERRRHDRKRAWVPVEITGSPCLAVVRDVSTGGLSVATARPFDLGERLGLALVSPADGARLALEAEVVRAEPNADDPDGLFPHVLGLRLDAEHPELEKLARLLEELREQAP